MSSELYDLTEKILNAIEEGTNLRTVVRAASGVSADYTFQRRSDTSSGGKTRVNLTLEPTFEEGAAYYSEISTPFHIVLTLPFNIRYDARCPSFSGAYHVLIFVSNRNDKNE